MNIEKYWSDIDLRISNLVRDGFVKLPSLKAFDLDTLAKNISVEMGYYKFNELGKNHRAFLDNLLIDKYLTPKLFNVAKELFDYKGDISNQYHIARKVEPGNSKEMFRAHFDSHLFTMVIPIKIPNKVESGSAGELIFFPKARKIPSNELSNIFSKTYHKRFASQQGLEEFSSYHQKNIETFIDLQPLLFIGNTTLHTNYPVTDNCSSYRLTLLAHFFDPSPKYGIGNLLRVIRNR
jgi:hypothetical protein